MIPISVKTMISGNSATTPAVVMSKVMSAPSKADVRSARNPAPLVTCAMTLRWQPGAGSGADAAYGCDRLVRTEGSREGDHDQGGAEVR
jgi:hypothetical protein